MQPLPWNNGGPKPAQPHNSDNIEKSKIVPRSRSDIDPQAHVHVLERLVSTTAQVVENIPIFLELLDQPVKDPTLRPFNIDKWKELLHTTLGLLGDQSTFSTSAACTLTRTMMICYNPETADQQVCLTLRHHLGRRETDEKGSRMPLNLLFSSCLSFWLGASHDMLRTIGFLEPSHAADAELLWMVNTYHRAMQSQRRTRFEFFTAVLTYVSSTEQSRRSPVPLTAAVIYATQNTTAVDIQPGTVSISESVPMTFHQIDGIDALDLWSDDCIQIVRDLFQWRQDDGFQLSLIAALYIDSTKHAHAHSIFADLIKYTNVTGITSRWSDAYGHKLAIYGYMAVSQKPLNRDGYPLVTLYKVIRYTIRDHSILHLPGLHILEIAVKHGHKTAPLSSDWLKKEPFGLTVIAPGERYGIPLVGVDHWILLHLDTLLAPQPYLLPEEVTRLKWSDTPEKVYIANARLVLYDSLAKAGYEGAKGPRPDPELFKVFLWSKDHGVCTHTFRWCLDLVPIGQPGTLRGADSTVMFIPERMGYEWIEHFIHVLCKGGRMERVRSGEFLISHLVPKWSMLPSSWRCDFASVIMFSIVQPKPQSVHGLPAYQCLIEAMPFNKLQGFIQFLANVLELIKSSLTWGRLTLLENRLTQNVARIENQDVHIQMGHILAIRKQQLVEETLECFAELPMAGSLPVE
jgi:hypothetical protein